jgi:hypothetical protein
MHYMYGITEYSQFRKTEAKWRFSERKHSKSKQPVVILVNSALCTLAGLCSVILQFLVQLFCGIFTMSTLNGAIMSHVSARNPLCSLITSDNSRSSSVVIVIRLQTNDRGIVVRKSFTTFGIFSHISTFRLNTAWEPAFVERVRWRYRAKSFLDEKTDCFNL